MFFDLVKKNSSRNRKENGLYFSSLIVTIIAFYIILSLQNQDVIRFLKKMESNALDKLFLLIPVIYGFSLFLLFFLIYFAGKYQLDRRSKELGMYLMMGMSRGKLLWMLIAQEIWNSMVALVIGIPIAVFLSEVISLITAKLVGLGIIGHHFSFSVSAVLWTILGFFSIRFLALLILGGSFSRKQIDELLIESQEKKNRKAGPVWITMELLLGIGCMIAAYKNAIWGNAWVNLGYMSVTVLIGVAGTILFFHGIGILFHVLLHRRRNRSGLRMFTFRQLQESVFQKPNTLAISSLLMMLALCCFAYGIAVGYIFNKAETHVVDYTFQGKETQIKTELQKADVNRYLDQVFEMKIGRFSHDSQNTSSAQNLIDAVQKCSNTPAQKALLTHLQYFNYPYFISLSSYNKLLQLAGKDPIVLNGNQAAIYNDPDFTQKATTELLKKVLAKQPSIRINNENYGLIANIYQDSVVTDRSITISFGLIIPDKLYDKVVDKNEDDTYWNAVLKKDYVEKEGLLHAIANVNDLLDTTNVKYESYLQNMARSMFYTVAASYTTLYLAIIFLIIANTVLGTQFLIHQEKTKRRYQTLIKLGADYESLCKSAREQINWYFSIPILVASVSAIFGTRSLFQGIATTSMRNEIGSLMLVAIAMILFACVVEFSYVLAVKKMSDRNMKKVMEMKREDD